MMKKPTNKVNTSLRREKSKLRNTKKKKQKQKLKERKQKILALITRYYYTLLHRSHVVLDSRTLWIDIKTLQEQSFAHKVLHRLV